MARHFQSQTPEELSDGKSSPFKLSSLPTSNKWNISEETHSNPLRNSEDLCNDLAEKSKLYKHMLRNVDENSMQGLYMVDAMQRLNIDHHFKEEIDAFLENQYVIFSTNGVGYGHELHEVALRFRLLRKKGYYVPEEVFGKFTGMEERFKEREGGDVKGMIELYEASQLSMAGEAILDEAEQFSGKILKERIAYLNVHEAEFVRSVLEQPFHKSLPMFTCRNFFGDSHDINMNSFLIMKSHIG